MLKPKQIEWCDQKLCLGRYREFREQADRARADTDSARKTLDEFRIREPETIH